MRAPIVDIVVPCYNEGARLDPSPFLGFLTENPGCRLCFVNDGSTDDTSERIAEIAGQAPDRVTALDLPANGGKAEAVRAGINAILTKGGADYVGYWDADLATPLAELPAFLAAALEAPCRLFICGSRVCRMGADVRRHWYRHYFGRVFATAASIVLHLPIYDTQCGAKLIHADIAEPLFREPFMSRWLFDVELIARLIAELGYAQTAEALYELPLSRWEDKGNSKVKLSYLPRVPWELWRIARRYRGALRGGSCQK